ncbi:CdaR family transcriptional regulator [Planococcus shenhongbingii]|uniref:Sugar diacid recognition domain-containing protein n=1 Tax=Planococcus shenhongbingii TaxID=3058398 RepID=A0ABT8NBE9_9BACL|nr:sugar diacid recognition domain-containing protein [Planococcus sp. N017]MDN7245216.1 sugar diacid recognition domain-containing protein [Planococcus sp. N017]
MQKLTKKIANEIVRETSLRLQRNVNIMNTDGIIISALDKSRIGAVHEGALEVLATKKTLVIYPDQKWEGAQPGVNLPLVFRNQIIGVIGITGNPEDLVDIGELVKMTTELMIKQEFLDSQLEWKQRTKEMVAGQLLKKDPSFKDIHENLRLLEISLVPPFTSIIVQISERSLTNRAFIEQVEGAIGKRKGIVSFINFNRLFIALTGIAESDIPERVASLHQLLKSLGVKFRIAYSLPFYKADQFSQSYKDCEITLEISDAATDCASFANIEVKSLFYQVDETVAERFSHRVLKNFDTEKAETLEVFFANNQNIQQTADKLFLHRNTLIYRLKKIIEDTGYDPKSFEDALVLQVALWIFQKKERKSGS